MEWITFESARGFTVGDVLRISCAAEDATVARTHRSRVLLHWPWLEVDQTSSNSRWDGTIGLPRDPDAYDWCNTPWRTEPDTCELSRGDQCFVGIPPTEVRVMGILRYEPPADVGWLPRPEWALDVCPVDSLDDEEAGYVLYLDSGEPIEIEVIAAIRTRS